MNPRPPPRGLTLTLMAVAAVVVVGGIALIVSFTGDHVGTVLDALARLESATKWGPVPVVDAALVVVVLLFVLATSGFLLLTQLAVGLVCWGLQQLRYAVDDAPKIPQVSLLKACSVPLALWIISVLVIAVGP